MIYNPERFIMPRMYHTADLEALKDSSAIVDFVKRAVVGEKALYWETEKVPKTKYT